jgi:hypothetical protein
MAGQPVDKFDVARACLDNARAAETRTKATNIQWF